MNHVASAGLIATSFRTLPPCDASRPATVTEALAALADTAAPAVLAGGTDLPARFNEGFTPTRLVDVSRIVELREVRLSRDAIEIGAAVTHAAGCAHPLIRQHLPGLGAAWSRIANVRIRFSATIGGNLMARRTRYEGSVLLSALGATVRLRSAAGERDMPVEAMWSAEIPGTALLTTIVVPLRPGLRLDYARDLRPIMTQAVALANDGSGRVVTATEYTVPCVRSIGGADPDRVDGLLDLADPVTSPAYLRRASAALLARQLDRMKTS